MAKVMNHRIENLLMMLDSNETQLNVTNINEISIESPNVINEAYENNSCSSIVKVKPILMSEANGFIVDSAIEEHTCETSNTKFSNSTQLNIHNRIHLEQKRFACDQCEKTFTQKSNLLIHKRTHTGERPYSCELCPMKFAQSNDLTKHKRTHTGERPYQCDLCPKKFSQSSELTAHTRTHTLSPDLLI
jgi:uncharacterized Zn-finger protein